MGRFGAETIELEGKLNFYIVKMAKNWEKWKKKIDGGVILWLMGTIMLVNVIGVSLGKKWAESDEKPASYCKNEKLQSKKGKKDLLQPPPLSKTTSATRATHQNDRLNQARPTVSKPSPETHY
jgi:hypothetical protein